MVHLVIKNERALSAIRAFAMAIAAGVAGYMTMWSYNYVRWSIIKHEMTPTLQLPTVIFQISILIGAVLMLYYFIREALDLAWQAWRFDSAAKEARADGQPSAVLPGRLRTSRCQKSFGVGFGRAGSRLGWGRSGRMARLLTPFWESGAPSAHGIESRRAPPLAEPRLRCGRSAEPERVRLRDWRLTYRASGGTHRGCRR